MRSRINTQMRRLISLFLAVILTMGVMPVTGFASDTQQEGKEAVSEEKQESPVTSEVSDSEEEEIEERTEKDTYLIATAPETEDDVKFRFHYSLRYPEGTEDMDDPKSVGTFGLLPGEKYTFEMVPVGTEYFLSADVEGDCRLAQEMYFRK